MAIRHDMRGITSMNMCFECKHQNIMETSHEWIECRCKKDGKMHNPYRPMVMLTECPNFEKEEDNEELQTSDKG